MDVYIDTKQEVEAAGTVPAGAMTCQLTVQNRILKKREDVTCFIIGCSSLLVR